MFNILPSCVTITVVSDTEKEVTLTWKFSQYDKNKNGLLHPVELFLVRKDILELFGSECWRFKDQLNDLLDEDNDGDVTNQEWNDFFALTSPGMYVRMYVCTYIQPYMDRPN